jgi:alkanesulfonate monooxygenase SsuD/methylene tetrahydromethanopterin reductase-like flavin-dependent oxidoreductase (luciferase family)
MSHDVQDVHIGVEILPESSWPDLLGRFQRAEEMGFDSAWDCDHFVNPYAPDSDWFEGWTLLAAVAARTDRIRLGTLVTSVAFHNPAFLAREALTVDHISNGRLIIGLGTGSTHGDPSYPMTGIPDYTPAERVSRLAESAVVVDKLLRDQEATFAGRHYIIQGAQMRPGPVQRPRPQLLIAALGPATIGVAARYADIWNSYVPPQLTLDEGLALTRERSRQLDERCAAIGRDPAQITRSLLDFATYTRPYDSVDQVRDVIERYHVLGIREFIFYWPADRKHEDTFERIFIEVLNQLRRNP